MTVYSASFTVIVGGIVLLQLLQVVQNGRTVSGDLPQCQASVHLPAVGTGIQPIFPDAVMHGAELVAKGRFGAINAASGAVDHVRQDRYPVALCPQGGGFFPQGVVVCDCCDSGIAFFAAQSAAADHLVYVFQSYLHKISIHISVAISTALHGEPSAPDRFRGAAFRK